MVIVINSVIGGFSWVDLVRLAASTVQLPVSDHSQLSDYTVQLQLFKMISEKKTVTHPAGPFISFCSMK